MNDHPALRHDTDSAEATEAFGVHLGAVLEPGDLIAIDGDLGAGKTCLVRGIAAGLGIYAGQVRSPTFVLHHIYSGGRLTLHHLDCYRLGEGADLGSFDLDDLLADGVVAVEWGSYATVGFAPRTIRISIVVGNGDMRRFSLDDSAPERIRLVWSGPS